MSKKNYSPEATKEIENLMAENALIKRMATTTGFYEYYFSQLPHYESFIDCFNAINDQYYDLVGEYRYSSYVSFRNTVIKRNKK